MGSKSNFYKFYFSSRHKLSYLYGQNILLYFSVIIDLQIFNEAFLEVKDARRSERLIEADKGQTDDKQLQILFLFLINIDKRLNLMNSTNHCCFHRPKLFSENANISLRRPIIRKGCQLK